MPYYDHKEHIGEVFFGVSIRCNNSKNKRTNSRNSRSSRTSENKLYTKTIRFDTGKVLGMEALCKLWKGSQGNDPRNKKFAPPQLTYFINTIYKDGYCCIFFINL